VFGVAPRLEDSYLNVPMVVCKRYAGGQPITTSTSTSTSEPAHSTLIKSGRITIFWFIRADSGGQPQVPLYRKENYMNIRDEQNRNTAVERYMIL